MKEIISDADVEKAIQYLANSSKQYADEKAHMKWLEYSRKVVRAQEVLRATGKTMSENNTRGEASKPYQDILIEYRDAIAAFTLTDAYRRAAELKLEVFRTQESSNRRGNI